MIGSLTWCEGMCCIRMEGSASSDQQRGNVDGKHEKGLGDAIGTLPGRGLASSDNSSGAAGAAK